MNRSLHLKQLSLTQMPGIAPPFTIDAEAGVNLILGPNESGKSSIARAVRLLLWPQEPATSPFRRFCRPRRAVAHPSRRCDIRTLATRR